MRALLRGVLGVAFFCCGFGLTAAWIHEGLPERMKITWFHRLAQDVDVVFLGSSHVYKQFDPLVFDQERGIRNDSFHAINMGALGMSLTEEMYLLDRILDEHPQQLEWVVVEALPFSTELQNENDFGIRRIEWHDVATTWLILRAVWQEQRPWPEKWDLIRRHGEHCLHRLLNLARGPDFLHAWGEDPLAAFDLSGLGPRGDGYLPLQLATASQRSRKMHKAFVQHPQQVLQAGSALLQAGDGGAADDFLRETVRRMEARASAEGVGLIWWIHPNLERISGWRQLLADGAISHLLAYDDPARFPEFYQVEWRFDRFHLNKKGSTLMTRAFAQDFLQITGEKAQ